MTLNQTAELTRKIIKYGIYLLFLLIIGRVIWNVGYSLYIKRFPPPPPPPKVEFGQLPALVLPKDNNIPGLSYSLETPTGELPKTPTIAKVYFMPQTTASFLALEEARQTAGSLGFSGSVTSLSETIYRFEHKELPANIEMNIANRTFSVNFDLSRLPEIIKMQPRSAEEAISSVRSFLSSANLLTPELAEGKQTVEFLKAQPPDLVSAISLSEANFIRVNLFRKNYDDLQVFTPNPKKANVWFLVSGDTSRDRQIVAGEYHYFPVTEERSSTYPIKTPQEAWDELVAGKGSVAQLPQDGSKKIVIRRVSLGYYDPGQPQGFMQPIFVFEGDSGFVAYVPAITSDYYGNGK